MELLPFLFMSSCFLTLSGLTFGDESGTSVIVKEGDDAILPCSLGTNENIEFMRFEWTKEGTEKKVFICDTGMVDSPALPGRVSHFPDDLQHGNASIKINNVQLKDGGIYTCNFPTRGKTFRIELVVGKSVIKVTVKEDDDAILPCSLGTNVNIKSKVFDWKKEGIVKVFLYKPNSTAPSDNQFKDRVSHFPGELEHGNASIKISKIRVEDRGIYTCIFPDSETKFYVELAVGVAQPFVIIPDRTNDWALLQCDVKNAYPKPTVEWWDSNNKISHSEEPQVSEVGGRFYITVKTNVTKDDRYRCVAKQEYIGHQAHTEISVELKKSDSAPQGLPVWAIALIVGLIVAVIACGIIIVKACFGKKG
ncbi:hypothetical protein ACER0C_019874 [Sarotherodon galilaeus]